MKVRSVLPIQIAKIGYIVLSVLFCALGVLFIVNPGLSLVTLARICGAVLVVFGVVKLVGYFSKDLYRLAFQFDLQFGILLVLLGGIVLAKPQDVANFLCIAFGVAVLADGLFKTRIAADSKTFGIRSWWLTMVLAILDCLGGLLLMFRPSESLSVVLTLLGISLLVEGILNLWVALTTVRIVKDQKPDVITVEYEEKRF